MTWCCQTTTITTAATAAATTTTTTTIAAAAESSIKSVTIHYIDVIMSTMASQITSHTVVYTTVYSDADQRKHQSSTSLAFVWGIHHDRWIPRITRTGEFPAERASYAENVSIWWRHRDYGNNKHNVIAWVLLS